MIDTNFSPNASLAQARNKAWLQYDQQKDIKNRIWETYAELADNAYRKGLYDITAKMLLAVLKDLREDFPNNQD